MSKLKKALYILIIIIIVLVGIYIILILASRSGFVPEEQFWDYFKKWGLIGIIGVGGTILIVYLIINKIIDRKKDKTDGSELPKEYVDTDPAIKTFLDQFIKNTKIPAYIDYSESKEGKIVPKRDAVDVTYTKKFAHPLTGVPHIEFEVVAKEGTRRGINFVIIRLDEGLEKIKNNWNAYISPHTTNEMHRYNNRQTPLTTAQDENARLHYALLVDGFNKEDMDQLEKFKVKEKPMPTELSEEELEKLNRKKELEESLRAKPKT